MTYDRRSDDQLIVPMFIVGIGCLLIAGGLALTMILTKTAFTTPVVLVISLFGGGGLLLMPTHRVIAAIRFWRRTNGDSPKTP